MEKKYQVFISSTYKDLKVARLKVRDAILSLYHFPVGMEMFGSLDDNQWTVIQRDIKASDYYVLIIGKMYGSEVPNEGISYTQKEYRYAVECGIPVLAFIMREDAEVSPSFAEKETDRINKLNRFKEEVENERLVSFWSNADELANLVTISLLKQIAHKPRSGWIKASDFNIEKSHAELLELNERIRTLEDENKSLRQKRNVERKPDLHIELINPIILKISDPEPVPDFLQTAVEKGIKYRQYGLGQKMTENDASELVERFKTRAYIMSGFTWLDFIISNNGNCKATDITIDIEIPDGIMVYENLDLQAFTELSIPGFIVSENRKKPLVLNGVSERYEMNDYPQKLYNYARVEGWKATGRIVRIEDDEIRHYKKKKCDEFFLTASKAGVYTLKCKIMCAEYKEPIIQELRVKVIKQN